MDVLIPVALLIAGLIIGFFVARYMYTRDGASGSAKQAEQNIKELMSQQATHHIHQTRQAVESIEKQCQALKQQVADYETLLTQGEDGDAPAYLSMVSRLLPIYVTICRGEKRANLHRFLTLSLKTLLTQVPVCLSATPVVLPQKRTDSGTFSHLPESVSDSNHIA